ncbi:hypothetical protein BT93_H0536 [Corymbia citriodora subsp. variegata]|nr:hypothetical protein BT93_H0536 [Corymbia citriodora subsp. variegata]
MSDEASATPPTPSLWSTVNSWFTPPVLFLVLNLMIGIIAITSQYGSSHGSTTHEHQKDQEEHETQKYPPAPPVARPPSIFQRLKSIVFFWSRPEEQPTKAPEMETRHQHYQFQEPEHEHEQRREQGPEQEQEQEQENPSHFARSPSVPQKPKPSGLYGHIVIEPTATPTPTPTANVNYPDLERVTRYNFRQEQAQVQEQQGGEDDGAAEAESGAATNRLPRTVWSSASVKYPIDEDDEEEDGDFLKRRRPASAREATGKIGGQADEEVDARADDFINRFKHQLKLQRMESVHL